MSAVVQNGRSGGGAPEAPLVTIVVSAYNAGEYLRPALLSIISQTYRNLDILILDDGSTDDSFGSVKDILGDHRVRVIHQDNVGKPATLNRALELVRGEFYAIQDADDISHPARIERQLSALLSKPHLAAAFCGNELIIGGRKMAPLLAPKSEEACRHEINAFRMPAHDPTGMFRMSIVRDMRYDPTLKVAETFDYILRIGEAHSMVVLGECLYGYRILPNSLTRRAPLWREKFVVEALRRACDRRGLQFEQVFGDEVFGDRRSKNCVMDNNIAAHFMSSVLDLRRAKRRWAALKTGWECIRLHPTDPHYYKALVYALLAPKMVSHLRRKFLAVPLGAQQ